MELYMQVEKKVSRTGSIKSYLSSQKEDAQKKKEKTGVIWAPINIPKMKAVKNALGRLTSFKGRVDSKSVSAAHCVSVKISKKAAATLNENLDHAMKNGERVSVKELISDPAMLRFFKEHHPHLLPNITKRNGSH